MSSPSPISQAAGTFPAPVRRQLRADGRSDWELLCVIDDEGRLLGTLSAAELLVLPDAAVLGDVVHRDQPQVRSDTDQEEMASMALRRTRREQRCRLLVLDSATMAEARLRKAGTLAPLAKGALCDG